MMEEAVNIRTLSVGQWHALSQDGLGVPMRFMVNGNSMRPLIRKQKDVVTLLPIDRPPRAGDVVLFRSPMKRYVLHRVWRIHGERVQTIGDGCLKPDAWITRKAILGRAVSIQRGRLRIRPDSFLWRTLGIVWSWMWPIRRGLHWPVRIMRSLKKRLHTT